MGMDQYLLIPFLVGWTSIYQLFWCSPGVQGFDTLPYKNMLYYYCTNNPSEIRVVGFPAGICRYKVKKWGGALQNRKHGSNQTPHSHHSLQNPSRQPHFCQCFFPCCTNFLALQGPNPGSDAHKLMICRGNSRGYVLIVILHGTV